MRFLKNYKKNCLYSLDVLEMFKHLYKPQRNNVKVIYLMICILFNKIDNNIFPYNDRYVNKELSSKIW